ncbi:MAG: hypothetical protein HY791_39015 [Deltaproteobacteria bacterium]|nr:hypothetical protein [Deltaproteobacteria bacterium]
MQTQMLDSLFRIIDLPAREAAKMSQRSPLLPLLYAGSGIAALALATLIAQALTGARAAPALAAAVLSVLAVGPGSILAGSYVRLNVSASTLAASLSFGLFAGGLASIALVPLVAFLSLVDLEGVVRSAAVVLPAIFLVAASTFPARVLAALDPSLKARVFSAALGVSLLLAFGARIGLGR